jgi:outer membrane PBP1 activator LpoA protein
MTRHLLSTALIFMVIMFLTGCVAPYQNRLPIRQPQTKPLSSKEKPQKTIKIIQHVTEKRSNSKYHSRLSSIESLLNNGDNVRARKQIESIDSSQLGLSQLNILKLLTGQLHLSTGNTTLALKQLQFVIPQQLEKPHKLSYYQSLAFAYSLNDQSVESIKAKIALSELLTQPEQQQKNSTAIMESLTRLSEPELVNLEITGTNGLSGWASLARLLKSYRIESKHFKTTFIDWQHRYPEHPANSLNFENLQSTANNKLRSADTIAILLPQSGRYTHAALAIKAGLLAASNNQNTHSLKPNINFYDSSTADIQGLYQQAINSGAKLIIGPLQKKKIAQLAQLPELNIPVLALNRVAHLAKDNLYQFGLSPEDEAEQIADKAFMDGHRNALLLVPDTALGHRIAHAFSNAWEFTGGRIVEAQTYNPKKTDYSFAIKQLLNYNDKTSRTRIRQDADVIILAGRPREARLLNPQLRFYWATNIPIYATSQIYSGRPNPSRDMDLNNITFCDAPWLFSQTYQGQLSMQNQENNWRQFPSQYLRLFAMGIDSYGLLPYLDAMTNNHYPGATGKLILNQQNHIKRQLVCAKFTEGIAQPIDYNNSNSIIVDVLNTPPNTALSSPTNIE